MRTVKKLSYINKYIDVSKDCVKDRQGFLPYQAFNRIGKFLYVLPITNKKT